MPRSQKTTPAAVEFIDIAGLVAGASKGEGLGNQFLAHIRECDAVAHVVRCFEDPNVVHVAGDIDPVSDIETIHTELALADLATVEKAYARYEKPARAGGDKEAQRIIAALDKLRPELDAGRPARGVQLTNDCTDGGPDCPRSDERSSTARAEGEIAAQLGGRQWLKAIVSSGEEWITGAPTGSHRRPLTSLALSDDVVLPLALTVHPALRIDRVGPDTAVSPGVTATVRPAGPLELRAGWGLSFRPASFAELYLDQGGVAPNETLSPERAWSADAGAAWRSPHLTLAANVFWSRYRELILYQLYPPFRSKPYNTGAARIAGVELQGTASLPWGVTAEAAYTFLDAVNLRSGLEGHHLVYRPPHQLFGRLARRGDRLEGYAGLTFRSEMPRDAFDSAHLPAQLRIDAGAGIRAVGPLWIDFEVKNLLDDQTQQDLFQYPLPGLSLALIARARL